MSNSMSLNLHNRQTQSLKQSQRLIMSPQMQQALSLLQLPQIEMEAAIDLELQRNPCLEQSETHDRDDAPEHSEGVSTETTGELDFETTSFAVMGELAPEIHDHFAESGNTLLQQNSDQKKLLAFLESSIPTYTSLFNDLIRQVKELIENPLELEIAEHLIGNLDEHGFFTSELEEVAALTGYDIEQLRKVLQVIQTLQPNGIGARNIPESMLIQLTNKKKSDSLAFRIITEHYQDLLHNRIPFIEKKLESTREEVLQAIKSDILTLNLSPGSAVDTQPIQTITADVKIGIENGMLEVQILDDRIPSLRLNKKYLGMLADPATCQETREYIKEKIMSGRWLLKNISQRHDTLYRIADHLCRSQLDFLAQPDGKLKPLTMKEVSEELELHESTIARAVANKYVETPKGVIPLRHFFTNGLLTQEGTMVSSRSVKDLVRDIVDTEDKTNPFSDEIISGLIQKGGVKCARRTVAKYRKELKLGSASQRKKYE